MPKNEPVDTFQIAFEVDGKSGYITTTEIVIRRGAMDSVDTARIDLADHPLYKQLQQYVLANPR